MIKHFTGKFLKGFFALLPFLLSVYILIWLLDFAETLARNGLLFFLPDSAYLPGLGILAAILVIYSFGSLIDKPVARSVFKWIEEPFQFIPVVRTVYQAIKDFTSYLTPNRNRSGSRVVVVRWPGTDMDMVGLVTRESLPEVPEPLGGSDRVAVYFPMSYQFGGYTVFLPKSQVRELKMGTEEAMRMVLTAWVSGTSKKS